MERQNLVSTCPCYAEQQLSLMKTLPPSWSLTKQLEKHVLQLLQNTHVDILDSPCVWRIFQVSGSLPRPQK